jgi:hypothetical protein
MHHDIRLWVMTPPPPQRLVLSPWKSRGVNSRASKQTNKQTKKQAYIIIIAWKLGMATMNEHPASTHQHPPAHHEEWMVRDGGNSFLLGFSSTQLTMVVKLSCYFWLSTYLVTTHKHKQGGWYYLGR